MLRNILIVLLSFALFIPSFSQKKKGGGKKKATAPAVASKSPEQIKAEEDAKKQAALEEENKKKAEAEAERLRKLAEYDAKIKRVLSPDNKNKYSTRPILDKDVMFKKTVWRRLDMLEKQNRYFMSINKELPTLILEYVKMKKLIAYESDSLDEGRVLTDAKFIQNLQDPNNQMPDTSGMSKDDIAQILSQSREINTKQLTLIDIKEDVIFDKKRSRMYYDIISVAVYIPAALNPRGFNQVIATVKFKDVVELFKKDNRAIWFNRDNDSEHRNFSDAFDLRLFSSYVIKVNNPNDELIQDTYGGDAKRGRYGSEKAALDLMEYEHNLWEF
ncbi:MAG: gliding motility protein GldN [Cytophagales bacterium]